LPLKAQLVAKDVALYTGFQTIIEKLAGLEPIEFVPSVGKDAKSEMTLLGTDELHILLEGLGNPEEERAAQEKELAYLQGFLASVDAKLSNERFVANAKPELIEKERQKKADAEQKIAMLTERLG
jgi:valyl-tRNA synthetase